ncbi:MAG: FMN-binding protein [Halanaerobiales bacterium]|nr:FMN-binding protein [Halanaerobiales bacterium]
MKKKYILILFLVFIGVYSGIKTIQSNLERLQDLEIANVDLTEVVDGTYTGSFKVFPIIAEVKVTVKNHQITGVELLKHQSGQGAPADKILDQIVEAQTLKVDVISGATYSSKIILKAVENSLNNAIE